MLLGGSHRVEFHCLYRKHFFATQVGRRALDRGTPLSLPETLSDYRAAANRVMFVPDDRFSQVAGMRADGAVPVESTA
jgi:hypothetical protein